MKDVPVEELVKHVKDFFKKQENKNYLYLSVFFLIFSFFLIFIIRPTLKSAFQSKAKREELLKATTKLEEIINKSVVLQSEAEKYRDDFPLLFEAIPKEVNISQVMREVTNAVRENNLVIVNSSVSDIKLVGGEDKGLKTVKLKYVLEGKFSDFLKFMKALENQRRLKTIRQASFLRKGEIEINATGEAVLNIKLEIETYFF